MNRFIKKNLFFVGVLGLSALAVLVLLVLAVIQYVEMHKYISRTSEMRNSYEELTRGVRVPGGSPIPVDDANIGKLEHDIDGYNVKATGFRHYFGKPLQPALEKFAAKLKIKTGELTDLFRKFWENEKKTEGPREQTYRRFRESQGRINSEGKVDRDNMKPRWTVDIWDEAREIFETEAQKVMTEKIDERNAEEIFLSSLGLERNFNKISQRLEVYEREMQEKVAATFNSCDPAVSTMGIYFTGSGVSKVKSNKDFNDKGTRDEKNDETSSAGSTGSSGSGERTRDSSQAGDAPSDVIRKWEVISDLAKRMVKSKLVSLDKFSYDNLAGREGGSCRFYTYEIGVSGTEDAIRDFLNNLSAAYKENRVYLVRNLALKKTEDQAQDIIDVAQGILTVAPQEKNTLSANGDAPGMPGADALRQAAMRKKRFFVEKRSFFGEIVLGRDKNCTATIVLDYVVYSRDVLK